MAQTSDTRGRDHAGRPVDPEAGAPDRGRMTVASITIDPALLKEEDISMVQDLIVAAVNAGMTKSNEMVEAEIEKVTGGVSIPGLV